LVPGLDSFEYVESTSLFVENDLGALGPHEGLGISIVAVEIVMDRLLEVSHAPEDAAPDALGGDLGEEPLDQIEPGGAGRREMQLEARMPCEPSLHLGRFMRAVVVEHEMDIEVPLHAPIDAFQEADKLFRPVPGMALADARSPWLCCCDPR